MVVCTENSVSIDYELALAAEYDDIGMRRGEAVEAFRQQDVDGIDELSHGPIPSVSDLN